MVLAGGLLLFGLILLIISFIVFVAVWSEDGFFDGIKALLIGFLISSVLLVPGVYLANYMDELSNTPKEFIVVSECEIVALKDNSNINGSFTGSIFISSGYIEQQMHYFYMCNTNKGKLMRKVSSDKTYIIETNEKQPYIICKQEIYKDERANYWLEKSEVEYYIYVPEGTVDTTYKVDLQ